MYNSFDVLSILLDALHLPYVRPLMDKLNDYHKATYLHSIHVASVVLQIGLLTGYAGNEVLDLTAAGLLHDIGKMSVPVKILDKPSKLTSHEFDIVRSHPVESYRILETCEFDIPECVMRAALLHHRYLNGEGYPCVKDFRKMNLPAEVRIVTMCDIFCAIVSPRPYKCTFSNSYAIAELYEQASFGHLDLAYVQSLESVLKNTGLILNASSRIISNSMRADPYDLSGIHKCIRPSGTHLS